MLLDIDEVMVGVLYVVDAMLLDIDEVTVGVLYVIDDMLLDTDEVMVGVLYVVDAMLLDIDEVMVVGIANSLQLPSTSYVPTLLHDKMEICFYML